MIKTLFVILAEAGIQSVEKLLQILLWIPACAGMTL